MSDLFIVDKGDRNWKAKDYLHEWAELAHAFDVATGYPETGALLVLDGQWQKLDKLRILMGDEVIEVHGGWPLAGSVKEEQGTEG